MAKSCESECNKLHESRERPGQLAQILVRKSPIERREIREKYMAMYGEDLSNLLQKSTRSEAGVLSSVGGALWLWMLEPIEFDAVVAREALDQHSSETNYRALVEMFVGRKSSHVVMIKQAYLKRFRRQLDQDIGCIEPPHPFKKVAQEWELWGI
ncbi:hypothetical protein Acr_12g0005620 [Actinidia rufa]|uniref:Uncharacterized protein n=1 Tax=Actinidia rufa TaxID=165716 RepID=A0A7J0FH67_9ERIC|nr:hypothetical protein Acr_12g0005620 [Actinidia rufa]